MIVCVCLCVYMCVYVRLCACVFICECVVYACSELNMYGVCKHAYCEFFS